MSTNGRKDERKAKGGLMSLDDALDSIFGSLMKGESKNVHFDASPFIEASANVTAPEDVSMSKKSRKKKPKEKKINTAFFNSPAPGLHPSSFFTSNNGSPSVLPSASPSVANRSKAPPTARTAPPVPPAHTCILEHSLLPKGASELSTIQQPAYSLLPRADPIREVPCSFHIENFGGQVTAPVSASASASASASTSAFASSPNLTGAKDDSSESDRISVIHPSTEEITAKLDAILNAAKELERQMKAFSLEFASSQAAAYDTDSETSTINSSESMTARKGKRKRCEGD